MARPLRICVPGGVYHVIARGNARDRIYLDDDDRSHFLGTFARVVEQFGWSCHAYCLMDNHSHLLALCRYVVVNPVRAGVCGEAGAYRWSSYAATSGQAPAEPFLTTDWLLGNFAGTRAAAQARYRDFIAAGVGESLADRIRGERLGSESFLRERFAGDPPLAEIPRVQIEPIRPTLDELFALIPDAPVAAAFRRHAYTLREIAEYLDCHYSTVSRRLRREESAA